MEYIKNNNQTQELILCKQWWANFLMGFIPSVSIGLVGITALSVYCYAHYAKDLESYYKQINESDNEINKGIVDVYIDNIRIPLNLNHDNIVQDLDKILSIQYFDFITQEEKIDIYSALNHGECFYSALVNGSLSAESRKKIHIMKLKGEI